MSDKYIAAAKEILELLPFAQENEISAIIAKHCEPVWHPASEPPDTDRDVLLFIEIRAWLTNKVIDKRIIRGCYNRYKGEYLNFNLHEGATTHWCEMPEPPNI